MTKVCLPLSQLVQHNQTYPLLTVQVSIQLVYRQFCSATESNHTTILSTENTALYIYTTDSIICMTQFSQCLSSIEPPFPPKHAHSPTDVEQALLVSSISQAESSPSPLIMIFGDFHPPSRNAKSWNEE